MGPVFIFALLCAAPFALPAQRQASVGAGTGVLRYAGGSSFSALTISPAAQILSGARYLAASGSVSLLEGGVWASQGRGDIWSVLGQLRGTRLALSGAVGFSTRSDGGAAGSGSALIDGVRGNFALGAGVASGFIQHEPGIAAFRVRGRGWWQAGAPIQLSLTTEATRFLGAWYTDFVGGASYEGRRTVGSVWLSGRLSATYGSTAAASAALQYFLTPSIAVEASGGNYLRDPFQGLPRAGFIAAGLRAFAARRAITASTISPRSALLPLIAQHRGASDTVVLRFRMPGARRLGIAGNWNTWTPESLRSVGGDVWEAALPLRPGTYYFNLVVDGREWVVPGGVATISDGMGGLIAVLNVL